MHTQVIEIVKIERVEEETVESIKKVVVGKHLLTCRVYQVLLILKKMKI